MDILGHTILDFHGWTKYCRIQLKCGCIKMRKPETLWSKKVQKCSECQNALTGPECPSFQGVGSISLSFFNHIRTKARRRSRDIPFNITIDDVSQLWEKCEGQCALTGRPLVLTNFVARGTASVDRIDSSLGYEPDNIQFVHKWINRMKGSMSQQQFIELCTKVADYADQQEQHNGL